MMYSLSCAVIRLRKRSGSMPSCMGWSGQRSVEERSLRRWKKRDEPFSSRCVRWGMWFTFQPVVVGFGQETDSCSLFQYLIKVNEIKIRKGVDLVQNLIKYFHAQCKYVFHTFTKIKQNKKAYSSLNAPWLKWVIIFKCSLCSVSFRMG